MGTTKKKTTIRNRATSSQDSEFFVLDTEKIPISWTTRNGIEKQYPREYEKINSLRVNQSGVFPEEKKRKLFSRYACVFLN